MDDPALLLWLDRGKTLAYLLVALGVVGEFLVDRISDPIIKRRDAAQRAEIARLNKEAEQEKLARLKIEERLAWRILTPEQQNRIALQIAGFRKHRADIVPSPDSLESRRLVEGIALALREAGWRADAINGGPSDIGPSGVIVRTGKDPKGVQAGTALVRALLAEHIAASLSTEQKESLDSGDPNLL